MPSAALLHRSSADRQSAGDPRGYQRQPAQDLPYVHQAVDAPWFPEGGVAAPPFMLVNPLSHGADDFPGPGTANQLLGPATAEWVTMRDSYEQGRGVDPGRQWPRQHHSEAYDFESQLTFMPFPDQIGPEYISNLNRPEKAGWSIPRFSEQYQQSAAERSIADLMQTNDPSAQAFAIGWGYVG
jgi:hypothetical protein